MRVGNPKRMCHMRRFTGIAHESTKKFIDLIQDRSLLIQSSLNHLTHGTRATDDMQIIEIDFLTVEFWDGNEPIDSLLCLLCLLYSHIACTIGSDIVIGTDDEIR